MGDHIRYEVDDDAPTGSAQPAATYSVLSSAAALGSSSAINHAQLLKPSETRGGVDVPMRFTPAPGTSGEGQIGLSNYQQSQAAHAAHLAEVEREEREARHAERGLHHRKHSVSVSSKSHRTDMNGHVYGSQPDLFPAAAGTDGAPVAPPLASLHRSPSFDKRLIDSARFAGQDIEEEEELNQFTCAGVCAGSCCAPTSSNASSHYNIPEHGPDGRKLTTKELIAARQKHSIRHHHRGWYCHAPTWPFIMKVVAVLLVIAAGIAVSLVLYEYLHRRELHTFRDQMSLLCLERSNTIQSQLAFSTQVIAGHKAFFSLVKASTATELVQPFGTESTILEYASSSNTSRYVDFLIYCSVLRTVTEVAAWEASHNQRIFNFGPGRPATATTNATTFSTVPYYNATTQSYPPDFIRTRLNPSGRQDAPGGGAFVMPVDFIAPVYKSADLTAWDLVGSQPKLYNDSMLSATLGTFVSSVRSTLLQATGFGFLVTVPMYSTGAVVPAPADRLNQLIGVVLGIIPASLAVERAIGTLDFNEIDLTVFDRTAPENLSFLYTFHYDKVAASRNATDMSEGERTSSFFDYGTRMYEVRCTPSSSFVNSAYSTTPLLIAVGSAILFGIVLIMIILGCLYASMRRAMLRSQQLIQANRNKNMALDLLHEAKRISDEANRSKSDFLAFLCHELRNPLHAIVAMIDFLQAPDDQPDPVTGILPVQNTLTESQQESIDTIQQSVRTMSAIVNDALDMSKIEAGKITFEILRFSFVDLVTTLSACEKPRAQAKGIQLLLNVNPNVPSHLYGDPTRIRQVCSNLLSNSIKFTSKGYVIISLTKISVDSFALPMMASVEEAGESKFQSDLSRTALGTAHESGALSGGGEHWRGAAPGSTPAIGGRKLGGPAGVSDDIAEVGEEEEQLLINRSRQVSPQVTPQVGGRSVPAPVGNGQTDRANEDFLGLTTPPAEVELVHIRPSSRTGEQPTHDQVVASVLGNGGLSDAPAHRAGSAGPSGRASPRASNVPRSSSDGISPPAPMNSGNGPRVTLPPTLTQGGFPSASSSAASAVPRKVRPYTHVPLQPSSIPSSEPTLIDLTRDTDRPAVFMQGGTNNGSTGGGIARENLPAMGNSKLGRDQSSSRASSANTFISENVIIEISVTDTGMGIDPAALPLLFEPYSQAKLSVMRSFGGTGLGLAIVKQIVEMMQGSISVKSQVGEGGGTTMTIRLPLPTAPADSSSGEVSQNSHTSSNGNKHSRSQQDLLMFKKGGGSTTQQTEDSSKHSGNQQDAAGHNNNSPPLRPHLVQIRTQQSIGSSLGAGAVTPQSVYSTMESQSRSLQSTPPHLHRQALPGSTLLGHREISAPFMSANSSSVLPSRTLATSGQRNNSAGGNGAEDAQSSTVAASSTQAPNGTEQGRSPSNTSMNDPTRAAMLRNSAADAARAASPPNGEGTQVHDLDSLNLGLGLGLSQQEVSPEPELTTYQQMSSPHEVQERLLAAHSQSPPTTTDGASSSRPAGGLHPSSIHLNIAAVESEARQATGAAAGGSGGASGGESGYSSGATPIDVMGRLAALAALPTTAKAEETTFAPSSGGSLQQAQVQSAIGETEPAGAVASAFTTASSSSSSSSTTVASSTSVGAGAETTTKPLKVPRASAKQAAASAVKEKEQTAATVAAMSLLPASEQAANSLLGSMGSTAPRTPPVAVYPRDLRILIADDSPTNLKILARMLQGFNVTQAVNGADAVEKVRELILADPPLQPYTPGEIDQRQLSNGGGGVDEQGTGLAQQVSPVSETNPNGQFTIGFSPLPQRDYVKRKDRQFDVIFSDVVMPVMDGQTAAREIRKLERLYHLPPAPITALTANAFLEDRDKCAAAGMSHFIAKPFTKQNILAIVQLVCQQQNMQLQLSSPHTPATQKREMKAAQSSFSLNRPGSADNSPASNVSILSGPSVNSSSSSTGSLATTRAPSTSGSSRGSFTKTDAAGASQTVPISVRALSGASPATSVSSGLPPLTPNVMATPNSGNGAASSTVLSRSGSQDPLMSPASGQLTQ